MKRLFFLAIGLCLVSCSYIRAMERTVPIRHFVTCGNLLVKNPLERTAAGYQWVKNKIQRSIERESVPHGGMQVSASFLETIIGKPKHALDQIQVTLKEGQLKESAKKAEKIVSEKIKMKKKLERRIKNLKGIYEETMGWVYDSFHNMRSLNALLVLPLLRLSRNDYTFSLNKHLYPVTVGFVAFVGVACHLLCKYTEPKYDKLCEELHFKPNSIYFSQQKKEEENQYDDQYLGIKNLFSHEENEGNL